jgi:hypothetical protein
MMRAHYSVEILLQRRFVASRWSTFHHTLRASHQLITAFTREVASSYLAETLSPTVESLIEGPKLELDPEKITGVDLGQQVQLLGEKCNQVLQEPWKIS